MQALCFHVSRANWSEVDLQRDLPVLHIPSYLLPRVFMTARKMQSVPTRPPDTLIQQTPNCFTVNVHAVRNVCSTSTQIFLLACDREISPAYSLNPDAGICSNAHANAERKKHPTPRLGWRLVVVENDANDFLSDRRIQFSKSRLRQSIQLYETAQLGTSRRGALPSRVKQRAVDHIAITHINTQKSKYWENHL